MIRGVLLDVDGTLIDSVEAHAQSWHIAQTRADFQISYERVLHAIGMGSDQILPRLAGLRSESPLGRSLIERKKRIFRDQYLPDLRTFPFVEELLDLFLDFQMKLDLVSSADSDELELVLDQTGLSEFLPYKTGSDEFSSKPNSDLVRVSLSRLQLHPDEVLMLGDTPYDIEAALKVGVKTVVFRTGPWRDEELAYAVAIYDNPEDLYTHFRSSPFRSDLHLRPLATKPARYEPGTYRPV